MDLVAGEKDRGQCIIVCFFASLFENVDSNRQDENRGGRERERTCGLGRCGDHMLKER